MVDFGADDPFAGAAQKLKEHYGIDVPVDTVRTTTEKHGSVIQIHTPLETVMPERPGVDQLIAELDGSMIPTVETAPVGDTTEKIDRRKTRKLGWKEARLCLVHPPGSVTPFFGATFGGPDEAGQHLMHCAIQAGAGIHTKFHCVGDGASWIASQAEQQFGLQARYLIDFCHLCEYLAPAAERIAGKDKPAWMAQQKQKMKENQTVAVVESLRPFLEDETVPETDAPVRACHRYITNRPTQFDYQTAMQLGLPIGSGEIESAHRYIMQARLKIAGAWWKLDNAAKMVALRVARANQHWNSYWNTLQRGAA